MTKQLNQKELEEEKGIKADKKTVEELTNEISSSWTFKNPHPSKPVLLYLGGFQGSGKTSALELIRDDLELIAISPDQIRKRLFDRGWKRGEEFTHTVNAIRNSLVNKAILTGHNIAIDQSTTPARIELVKQIVRNSGYRSIFVYLDAPQELLEQRVVARKPFSDRYNGTVDELRASIQKYGYPNYGLYDRVIDSGKISMEQIADELKSYF